MASAELDEFVERVSERTDIHSVVSRYVQLTQKSGRFWGCCPFHNEKTASFCVSPDKGFFYCFGCGTGGNAFKFLSLIENISYFEAIKLQAQRLGIDPPARKLSPEEARRRNEEKILHSVNEAAQDFFHECLIKTARGEVGRKYLAARGITAETIETFKLGYAPDEWENLFGKLTRQGFTPKQLEDSGLVAKRKNTSGYYDRFRARVIIPISDVFGHVVGFGGRILKTDDEMAPKYLNTPETALFNKGRLLFGLDKSGRAINSAGTAVVVEGYMDAISLYSAGVRNVVATLGTAFTADHARLILRYARKIIFCYDSDEAGQRATMRALPIIRSTGAEVFIAKVPDGKDPDEFIRKHGKAAFEKLLKNAATLIDYRMSYVLEHADLTTIRGRVQALQEIFPVIVEVESLAERNEYCKKLSYTLVLDENVVRDELQRFTRKWRSESEQQRSSAANRTSARNEERRDGRSDERVEESSSRKSSERVRQMTEPPQIREACEVVLRMAWHEGDLLGYALTLVPRETFSPVNQEIIAWLEECIASGKVPDQMSATKSLSDAANVQLSRILTGGAGDPRDSELELFRDSLSALRRFVLQREYNRLFTQANEYVTSDAEAYRDLMRRSLKIKDELDKLREGG